VLYLSWALATAMGSLLNKLALGAAALAVLATAGSAVAADMNVPPVPYKAPVPVFSWTGFYVGGDIGARAAVVDASVTSATIGGVNLLAPPFCPLSGCAGGSTFDSNAFRAGVYAGYNWQLGERLVVGIEGDWHYADRSESINGWFYPGGSNIFASAEAGTSFAVRTRWDASARARVGVLTAPNTLLYATGGASWLRFDATSSCPATSVAAVGFCDPAGFFAFSPAVITQSATRIGWTAGFGAEAMVWGNWLLRAEYRYANYGTWGSGTDSRVDPTPTTLAVTYALKLQTHSAMFGLAYKFGGPVVANY